ncbi:MAG: hypothetical protein ACRD4O_00945 [Bryobacteraceae bacterium]
MGRFNSADPANAGADMADPQSWNGYSYVENNPLNSVDPLGLDRTQCANATWADACVTATYPGYWYFMNSLTDLLEGYIFGAFRDGLPIPSGGGGAPPVPPKKPSEPQQSANNATCSPQAASGGVSQYLQGVFSAASMTGQFLTGTGPINRTFGPSSVESQMMASSRGIAQAINDYNNSKPTGTYIFGFSGVVAAGFNPIQQFVGSYSYSVSPTPGGLKVTLSNYTSVWSGSYHGLPSHQRSSFAPLGTTHQTYRILLPCHN